MLQQNLGHTGQSPLLGPLFPSGAPPPGAVKVWQGFDKIKMSPVVGTDGTIYVGLGFSFCAINPPDPSAPKLSTKWCSKLHADVSGSAALLAHNPHYGAVTVYVGDRDNSLSAFKIDDGSLRWRYNFGFEGDIWASPAPGPNGEIYFVHTQSFDGFGTLTALTPTGDVKWKYTIGQYVFGSGAPAIHPNGRIYLASRDGFLYCFLDNTTSGTPCPSPWTSRFIGNFPSAVMIGPTGHLYMGSSIGLAKIDPDTGQVLTSFQTIGTAGMPALGPNGTIYVGSKSVQGQAALRRHAGDDGLMGVRADVRGRGRHAISDRRGRRGDLRRLRQRRLRPHPGQDSPLELSDGESDHFQPRPRRQRHARRRRHGHPLSGLRRLEAPRDLERAVRPGLQSCAGGPGG